MVTAAITTFFSHTQFKRHLKVFYVRLKKKAIKLKAALLVIYLFQDDDEAGSRWKTVGHHHIRRQESQTQTLVEQE